MKERKIRWDSRKELEFRDAVLEKLKSRNAEETKEVEWREINQIIYEGAEKVRMTKKIGGSNNGGSASIKFSVKWREVKKEMWCCLKAWLNNRSQELKEELNDCGRRLKTIGKEEIKKCNDEKWAAIDKARGMSEWWRAINKFRPRHGNKISEEIKKDEWVDHF